MVPWHTFFEYPSNVLILLFVTILQPRPFLAHHPPKQALRLDPLNQYVSINPHWDNFQKQNVWKQIINNLHICNATCWNTINNFLGETNLLIWLVLSFAFSLTFGQCLRLRPSTFSFCFWFLLVTDGFRHDRPGKRLVQVSGFEEEVRWVGPASYGSRGSMHQPPYGGDDQKRTGK